MNNAEKRQEKLQYNWSDYSVRCLARVYIFYKKKGEQLREAWREAWLWVLFGAFHFRTDHLYLGDLWDCEKNVRFKWWNMERVISSSLGFNFFNQINELMHYDFVNWPTVHQRLCEL